MGDAVYIYALCEEDSQEGRYIGKTNDLHRRCIVQHPKKNNQVSRWMEEVWQQGKAVLVKILQTVPADDANRAEKEQIAIHYKLGHRLLNIRHIAPLEKQRRAAEEQARWEMEFKEWMFKLFGEHEKLSEE